MTAEHDDSAPTEFLPPPGSSNAHGRFLPGTVLGGRYRIVALAGRGGMGEVYRADDLKLGQPVALKFLPVEFERERERLHRLLGEVRVARQVSHPNVCRVYDVGEVEGHHFITMEYVDGEDLAALLRRIGRLPQEKALDLARQICAGLAAAHNEGIVHRDLKPANIMLDGRGRARITDFGLAAAAEALRGKESSAGTPAYMAPEQIEGGEITPRTDVFALGLVLYELFTGRRAGEKSGASDPGRRGEEGPRLPSHMVPGLDPAVDAAILQCLEREPVKRPASAAALLAALPGGDLLAAVLRAGETPSPEMVAAAGEEGSLPAAKAWGLFAAVVVLAVAALFLAARISGLDQVPMPRTPDTLRDRAREIVRILGDDTPPRSTAWWVGVDDGYLNWASGRPESRSPRDAQPPAVRFYYRQSPMPIIPMKSSVQVTRSDPPQSWDGEVYLALDPQGNLLEFRRLARQQEDPAAGQVSVIPTDWSALLALTGADPGGLRPARPFWTPDVPSDSREAWVGDGGGEAVRIEAAAWRGKPVWVRTIAPWELPEREAAASPSPTVGWVVFVCLAVAIFLAFGLLARHNLRLGRSDSRGAFRVGASVFLAFSIGFLLEFRWAIDPDQIWRFLQRQPYFPAACAWLVYLGIEPFLRRRWPHRLIAWARLIEGRLANPLVGRELLIGSVAGLAAALVALLLAAFERPQDGDLLRSALPFGRAVDFWGSIAATMGDSLMKGLGSFALLLLLRVLLRRDFAAWLALVAVWVLVSLPSAKISPLQWTSLTVGAAIFVLIMRSGLLATIAAWLSYELIFATGPKTLDFGRWYAWRTPVVAGLLVLLAFWGFRAVMGRRKILSLEALEG